MTSLCSVVSVLVDTQVDTPMGVQPLPASKTGQSASEQLIQLQEKKGEKERSIDGNFG